MNASGTQPKRHMLLFRWIALWVGGFFLFVTLTNLINSISLLGFLSSQIETIIFTLYFSLFIIPISVTVWFVMKLILRCFNKSHLLEGITGWDNMFLFWLTLVIALFAYSLLKDLNSPRIRLPEFGQ